MTILQTPAGAAAFTPAGAATRQRCRAVVSDERCTDPGAYWAWLEDCPACRVRFGVLWCLGHPFCVPHAAAMRTGGYEHAHEDVLVTVTRMTGVLEETCLTTPPRPPA